jgi:hypothetical protein
MRKIEFRKPLNTNITNVIVEKISDIDWETVTNEINNKGYALVPRFLSVQDCKDLINEYDNSDLYRKIVTMEKHHFGLGQYKYFKYPLPDLIQIIRREIYPKLAPIANIWMKVLNFKDFAMKINRQSLLPLF